MIKIIKENCGVKVTIVSDENAVNDEMRVIAELLNPSFILTPKLAGMMIEALQEYQTAIVKNSTGDMKQPTAST